MSKHKLSLMLGTTWRMTHLTIICTSNHQMARFCDNQPSFSPFTAVLSDQRFLSSRWILSSAFTFAAVLLWFIDKILFNIWWSLSLSFGFRLLFLLVDYVLPWLVYVIILDNAALDTPNNVVVLVTDAPAKCAQTTVLFENLRILSFCISFIQTVTKHNL